MQESWIQLTCPSCGKDWEENPTDLPAPGKEFSCPECSERRKISEFMRSKRDLEVLRGFHE